MTKYKKLNRKTVNLDKEQLEQYLEKLASDQIIENSSSKYTYPIPSVKENFQIIEEVYHMLNEHIKLGLTIHPAGEWLLDNFYIIEESVKTIIKEMPLKKYKEFLGVSNGPDKGFARIYVLAYEIVNCTDNNINAKNLNSLLQSYQRKKKLNMEEIWNIGTFMQIALIENIKNVCEKIYFSQMQKYRAENILERLVENKTELKYKNLSEYKAKVNGYGEMKYPFIEYLSYRLKKEGRQSYPFMVALEEQVNKMGTTIEEVIKKEHFDIALKKVTIANCITSIKELLHLDFLNIFEEINNVESILRQDPAGVYANMDYKTKDMYRNAIKKMSKKTKIAETYIAQKALQLANEWKNKENAVVKKTHIGYYLIAQGQDKLYESLQVKKRKVLENKTKAKIYILTIWILSLIIDFICMINIHLKCYNFLITTIVGLVLILPIEEIVVQIVQYILSKIVKPKPIPKMDFYKGVPKECSTFVVIPTIIKSKERIKELMKKLEVYYLANRSENIYFALLGDCSSGANKEEKFDKEIIEEGLKQVQILNNRYNKKVEENEHQIPKFHFIYRQREWNSQEEYYLGWERKRGLLNQFNDFLLGKIKNPFLVNTLCYDKDTSFSDVYYSNDIKSNIQFKNLISNLPIKYVITLDADTALCLNSGLELIGAMSHILSEPILNHKRDMVADGHAIIQPRIGITMEAANKNFFTKIFAGNGGIDCYANAISDIYQDNFEEGIFTGKGIYNLAVFSEVLSNEIPENLVLSHDLLEGSYLRCALASDIVLMDGYPTSYLSYKIRHHRWIRGDLQILSWTSNKIKNKKQEIKENPLNILSKFKIIDNIIRAVKPIFLLISFITIYILNVCFNLKTGGLFTLLLISVFINTILNILDRIVYKKEGQIYSKSFYKKIPTFLANFIRNLLSLIVLPDKAYYSLNAIIKTIYRLFFSKKHLLEWTTSEDAEKMVKSDLFSYYTNMKANFITAIVGIILLFITKQSIDVFSISLILILLWLIAPLVFWYISKKENKNNIVEELNKEEKKYLLDIAKRTWQFFKDNLNKENNYLISDNYQEERKEKFVDRTSSTNIGLSILAVISSYDMGFENLEDTLQLLSNIIETINILPKWNGHLYNWYNIKTLEPLTPRYISTVDSGNFVGYVYVLKAFYQDIKEKIIDNKIKFEDESKKEEIFKLIPDWSNNLLKDIPIANADFSKLYDEEKGIFSIGFNIEENKLTNSYYDLLASEARQASFIAICKKDVEIKHWKNLGRTLSEMKGYNGLISWSGTAFEYLMPNIVMKQTEGSLIDESCKFMIMEQKEYAKKLGIPWGFSETAYYFKDLNGNYQYKAIGIPWLGLKRGLEEDMVVASYGSIMALLYEPKNVIDNIKRLEKEGMYSKYGFYESIDYTPIRMPKGKNKAIVKTYMAHHEALILLTINNLFNNNILQKRFSSNPEIEASEILLEEIVPEKRIITKEDKIKPEKIKYKDYENYAQRTIDKENIDIEQVNVLANEEYSIVMNQKGQGYSKYKNYMVNKFNYTSEESQGIFFYFKDIKNKRIWEKGIVPYLAKPDKYEINFSEDINKIKRIDGAIETTTKTTISPEYSVEIRNVKLKNYAVEDEIIEFVSSIEPALNTIEENVAHPAFQNLFLTYKYLEDKNIFVIKRKNRKNSKQGIYMAVSLYTNSDVIGEMEYEIDKEKFQGRNNLGLPYMVEHSIPFSKKIQYVVDPVLALKNTIKIKPEEEATLSLLISVSEEEEKAINNILEYQNDEKIKQAFELSKAKADTEARYLNLNAKQIETYQKMIGYLLFSNPFKEKTLNNLEDKKYLQKDLWQYGISGDLPILLVKISQSNEEDILEEVLKAYEFFRMKNIYVDLVILNEEESNYEKYTKEAIYNSILNAKLSHLQNIKSGIFILENADKDLLEYYANMIIDTKNGPIDRQLKDLEEDYIKNKNDISNKIPEMPMVSIEEEVTIPTIKEENVEYNNEYGGFINNNKEYEIVINKENKLPTVWSNIMANEKFGSLVTDSMGGFTWSKNSRLNRLSSWNNNQVTDIPSEIFYIQNQETLKSWSLGLNTMPDNKDYIIKYGFGYSIYEHTSDDIEQKMTVFIPLKDSVKVSLLQLKNTSDKKKKLNIYYYIKPVLGENEEKTKNKLQLEFEENSNMILLKNNTNTDFDDITYVSSSEKIKSYTGSKKAFLGKGNLANPDGLNSIRLDGQNSIGKEAAIVLQFDIELEPYETKEISFVFGTQKNKLECEDKSYQYTKINNCRQELDNIKQYWNEFLGRVKIKTPMKSFDIMMNGWLIYQTITSRLNAKSAFYQSGGAFGFRDQLQDTICLKYFDPDIMKNQIIKHSKHQFIEGDVEHWWHEETNMGIRTLFSDDLLWLVYLVEEYINFTQDMKLLEIETNFVKGNVLENGIDEKYEEHLELEEKASIFKHCEKAIEKSLCFGENSLPKIGSGDWNDGFSNVGNKGKGESVWLGFFLYDILKKWINICNKLMEENKEFINKKFINKEELKIKIKKYEEITENLKKALNTNAWDGRWYKRAFMDDGRQLGTIENEECKIDGISQSWATISKAGDNDKKYISMESLENHLIDKENGIIKLLDPAFDKSNLEPGYIKAYLPGTRENGGQYTHAAIWTIIAQAMLGFGNKAVELFRMINPIEHSKTKEEAKKYKVEPYVVAADIYGERNLIGRGGWTWYTGSASWMYEAGIHYILGLTIKDGYLSINPCISSDWKEYEIEYKYKNTTYNIIVRNSQAKCTGVETMIVDSMVIDEKKIKLVEDNREHRIEIIM